MNWLSPAEIQSFTRDKVLPLAHQILCVHAETKLLANDIPIQAQMVLPDEGPPATMRQWFGQIGERLVVVEATQDVDLSQSVIIYTHYLQPQEALGDWSVLLDLQALPASICISRPIFVESRALNPSYVVYRPAPQGWNAPIYNASSRADAEGLLKFLRQDVWNERCFVGAPEPLGRWATIRNGEVILGTGSELSRALKFACELSAKNPSTTLQVRDISNSNAAVYMVARGYVLAGC